MCPQLFGLILIRTDQLSLVQRTKIETNNFNEEEGLTERRGVKKKKLPL